MNDLNAFRGTVALIQSLRTKQIAANCTILYTSEHANSRKTDHESNQYEREKGLGDFGVNRLKEAKTETVEDEIFGHLLVSIVKYQKR
jgi:hypothetical protein